jgi:tetratricopeptide (TPR) repeat protein
MCRYIIIVWFSFLGFGILNAQQSPKERVYQAFISDQMDDWEAVIDELNRKKASLTYPQLAELVNYYYGYTAWLMEEGPKKKARRYNEEAEELVDDLIAKYPEESDWYAFKAAFIAFKIGMRPLKAPFLGAKSMENIDLAIKYGPESPQAWIEQGNALFYMPKAFGGSKEEALLAFNKAIQFMEKEPESLRHNWIYLNVLMILGQSYEKTDNPEMAKITYDKLLKIEPDFSYVRDELYPAFMQSYAARD